MTVATLVVAATAFGAGLLARAARTRLSQLVLLTRATTWLRRQTTDDANPLSRGRASAALYPDAAARDRRSDALRGRR